MKYLILRLAGFAFCVLAMTTTTQAAMIGITWAFEPNQSQAHVIGQFTGNTSLVGGTGASRLNSLTVDHNGNYWAGGQQSIYNIDPMTGLIIDELEFEFFGFSGPVTNIRSLAAASDGSIYAVTRGSSSSDAVFFWRLDPITVEATIIAVNPGYSPQALTFGPDGTLFGYAEFGFGNNAGLITIDPATGEYTDVNLNISSLEEGIQSLAFDADGQLFAASQSAFYSINPETGWLSFLANHELDLRGIAYLDARQIPIPAALWLMLSGLGVIGINAKRPA